MKRVVKPELLDELPADDPRALGSRRDIHRLNFLMGNWAILSSLLQSAAAPLRPRIVDLGAGDGRFMLELARYLSGRWHHASVWLVDNNAVVPRETRSGFKALGWSVEVVTADVFDWLRQPADEPADVIVSNLFLHHFAEPQLAELFGLVANRTRLFAACEPWRSWLALACSRMLPFIGCNAVTQHDAVASVRAGFANRELSKLWPARDGWRLREQSARLFTHAFMAERIGPP